MKLTEAFIDNYKKRSVGFGFGNLGAIVYLRTYSRTKEDGAQEQWWETVQRVVEGVYRAQKRHCDLHNLPWNAHKAQISAQRMYDLIFNFKFVPPGRGLWAMGTDYVEKKGSAALNNCAFISTADIKQDFAHPFCWLMDMSMLGVGVGSDTRGAETVTVRAPEVSGDFRVDDSREGWVDSVRVLLNAYGHQRCTLPKFDYSNIRKSGDIISGFGGIAPGSRPLQKLHEDLGTLLQAIQGQPISSSAIVDIHNLIGRAVVSGGIRRTAEIILGSNTDNEFLSLKDPARFSRELKSHRWASNNSVFAEVGMDYNRHVDQIMTNGEPGFMWIENARHYRRMKDIRGEWDTYVQGMNPCGEIALESSEFCNLVEVYIAHHDTWEDFQNTLKWAYLYAKSVSLIPTHDPQTNAVIGRNRRLGISITGIQQGINKFGTSQMRIFLDKGYQYVRECDRLYSKWLCVPESIKLTTVKPSGTVSLLSGATPGIHFPHAEYYIRNVRFDVHSPLLPVLKKAGYKIEESQYGDNTKVVSFPIKEEYFHRGKKEVGMWEQFQWAAELQHWWADNSVSVTVTVQDHEKKDLARALSLYETKLKSVSILPYKDHGYEQAPYIEIDRTTYHEMAGRLKDLNVTDVDGVHDIEEAGCTSDSCSII